MKFISWNVNGLRAVVTKGFSDIFRDLDADFFCLQETKLQEGQIDLSFDGYESYWNYAERKGYSGTAIFTKHTPLSVRRSTRRQAPFSGMAFWAVTLSPPSRRALTAAATASGAASAA